MKKGNHVTSTTTGGGVRKTLGQARPPPSTTPFGAYVALGHPPADQVCSGHGNFRQSAPATRPDGESNRRPSLRLTQRPTPYHPRTMPTGGPQKKKGLHGACRRRTSQGHQGGNGELQTHPDRRPQRPTPQRPAHTRSAPTHTHTDRLWGRRQYTQQCQPRAGRATMNQAQQKDA